MKRKKDKNIMINVYNNDMKKRMKKKDLKITKAGLHNIFEHRQKIELNQSSNIEDI